MGGLTRQSPVEVMEPARHRLRMRWLMAISALAVAAVGSGCSGYPRDEAVDWKIVSSDPASRIITVDATFGGCSTFSRVEVSETSELVRITAVVRTSGDVCKAVGRGQVVTATLRRPLGDRTILGGCVPPDGINGCS
jgi:hypothetical protein